MLFKKDRKILNLTQMVKNRDEVIDTQKRLIDVYRTVTDDLEKENICLKKILDSLELDRQSILEQAFENAKPKRTRKASTNK